MVQAGKPAAEEDADAQGLQKQCKKLEKALRAIEDLRLKQLRGERLEKTQEEKLAREEEFAAKLEETQELLRQRELRTGSESLQFRQA